MRVEELRLHLRQFNWITFFALLCVAVTSAFMMFMATKLTDTLASPDWCARAIKAEQLTGLRSSSSCVTLLSLQLKSLSIDNHIYAVTMAVCLGSLVIVVLAKARLDLQAARDHIGVAIGSDDHAALVAAAASGAAQGAVSAAATASAAASSGGDDGGTSST